MKKIKYLDKEFKIFIPSKEIQNAISRIADKMNVDFKNKTPLFLSILNGSFMFAADLLKRLNFDCQISFVKLSSYCENSTTGKIEELIGFNENIKDRIVIILDDIIDTGITLEYIVNQIKELQPAEIKVTALFLKPQAYKKSISIDYLGIKIPDDFVIGFGLDYNGFGRNLKDIYSLNKI